MKINESNPFQFLPITSCTYTEEQQALMAKTGAFGNEEFFIQYRTDPESVIPLLPEPFKPTENPIVTICFMWMKGNPVMDYEGYCICPVTVSARFDGEKDQVEGDYVIIMAEDNNFPIHAGRHPWGVAKYYVEFDRYSTKSLDHIRCEATAKGKAIYGVEFDPMKEVDEKTREDFVKMVNARPHFGYELLANPDYTVTHYPSIIPFAKTMDHLWLGDSGTPYFSDNIRKDLLMELNSINAIRKMPVLEVIRTGHSIGTMSFLHMEFRKAE